MVAGLGYFLARHGNFGPYALTTPLLFAGLASIALFDARYFIIPICLTTAIGAVGLATVLLVDNDAVAARMLAGVVAFGAMRAIAHFYRRFRGAEGLGPADADLVAAGAIWVGFDGLGAILLYATVSALLAAAIMRAQGTALSRHSVLPFGPHLAVGIWLVWIFGPLELAIG